MATPKTPETPGDAPERAVPGAEGSPEPAAADSVPVVAPESWPEPETDPSKVKINEYVTSWGKGGIRH